MKGEQIQNDKYIVFRAADVSMPQIPQDKIVQDAVVIRKQDIFAGPGLHAYAAAIQTGLELLFRQLPPEHEMTLEAAHEIEYLTRLRDFFFEQAVEAEHAEGKKLPD